HRIRTRGDAEAMSAQGRDPAAGPTAAAAAGDQAGVYEHVLDLIGRTPLVRVRGFDEIPQGVEVYAKLEWYNPGGSVKDRIGAWMLRDAAARGLLRPGGTISEPTAGNTGIGLALAAAGRYRVIFVVPEHFSLEKQALMRALGAEIVHTPRA